MAEADLGVRVFLIDNLSSPMGLVTGAVSMLGSALLAGMAQAEMMGTRIEELTAKSVAASTELSALGDTEAIINEAFANGNLTLAEAGALWESADLKQRELQNSMEESDIAAQNLQNDVAGLNSTMMLLGGTLGAAIDFFAFAEGLKQADSAASDLTNTMNSVAIAGNLDNANLALMQNYLMGVANTSIYTADQVGQGFSLLLEKGYSADQVMQGLGQHAINLSMAIGDQSSGTTGSVNLLATAMEVMQAKASDAQKYADLLTFAFYHGIPSVDGLRSALEQVGGRAQMLHIPFDQLIVALDQLGRAGMTGQQAGAALNYALQSIYAPIIKTQHELEYLGIISVGQHLGPALDRVAAKFRAVGSSMPSFNGTIDGLDAIFKEGQKVGAIPLSATFYQWAIDNHLLSNAFFDSKGNAKDLMSTLDILYQHLKGMNPEEQAAAFQQLFNVRSSQGVTQLMTSLGKLDATYQQLKKSNDAHGLSAEDTTRRLHSQSAQAQALKTTFTDFLAQVGKPIQDFFQGLLSNLNKVIGGFTTGSPQVHQFFTAFLVAGAVLSGVALAIGLVAVAVFALDGALLPIIAIVLGVMAGIALLAAGFALVYNWLQRTPSVLHPFQAMFAEIGKILGSTFAAVGPVLKQAFDSIMQALKPLAPYLPIIKVALGAIAAIILGVVIGAIVGLVKAFAALATGIAMMVAGAIQQLAGIMQFFKGMFEFIGGLLTGNSKLMHKGFVDMAQGIVGIVHGLVTLLEGLFSGLFGAILGFLTGFASGFLGSIGALLTKTGTTATQHFGYMMTSTARWLSDMGNQIIGWPTTLLRTLDQLFNNLGAQALHWGSNLLTMFGQGLKNSMGAVFGPVQGIAQGLHNLLGFGSPTKEGPGATADRWIPNLMHMLTIGLVEGTPALHGAASSAAGAIQSGFYSPGISNSRTAYATANASINGGTTTVPINVDGQTITTVVLNRLTGQLQMSGSGRMLR